MPNKEEINAVPVTPFFYDPVQVEAKTDVKSMPKLNADVKVKEIPKIQTEVETSEEAPINVKGNVTVKTDPSNPPQGNVTLNLASALSSIGVISGIDNLKSITAINDIERVNSIEHLHDVQLNGAPTENNPVHFVVDNASEIGTPDIQMNATVDDTTGTPNVVVTKSGDKGSPMFDFEFSGLKGEKGEQGEKGDAGVTPNVSATASASGEGDLGVNVTKSGTAEAPNFAFAFTGLGAKPKLIRLNTNSVLYDEVINNLDLPNVGDHGYYMCTLFWRNVNDIIGSSYEGIYQLNFIILASNTGEITAVRVVDACVGRSAYSTANNYVLSELGILPNTGGAGFYARGYTKTINDGKITNNRVDINSFANSYLIISELVSEE